ncbi:unnamed protein product, partial [Amoebophrya sp. A120]|eukprot:GSA120T00004823001.1
MTDTMQQAIKEEEKASVGSGGPQCPSEGKACELPEEPGLFVAIANNGEEQTEQNAQCRAQLQEHHGAEQFLFPSPDEKNTPTNLTLSNSGDEQDLRCSQHVAHRSSCKSHNSSMHKDGRDSVLVYNRRATRVSSIESASPLAKSRAISPRNSVLQPRRKNRSTITYSSNVLLYGRNGSCDTESPLFVQRATKTMYAALPHYEDEQESDDSPGWFPPPALTDEHHHAVAVEEDAQRGITDR